MTAVLFFWLWGLGFNPLAAPVAHSYRPSTRRMPAGCEIIGYTNTQPPRAIIKGRCSVHP